jgi:Carbamoyl-phosphate synthase L chain, ATP binding domain
LADAGCIVHAVCPSGHPLSKTRVVQQMHEYNGLTPLKSFADAIVAADPDFIIPGDDLATTHLHRLHLKQQRNDTTGTKISVLIERSLGAPENFAVVHARTDFMQVASQVGVRVPKTEVIKSSDDLRSWISRMGLPMILKADGTSGGDGVRVVHTPEEAESALRKLQAPPLLARAAKRGLVNQDNNLIWPSLFRRRHVVNAQTFIEGHEATSAVLCWEGSVLASLHFEVVNKVRATGHATVVRLIENREMSAAVEKIAGRLQLSGLHGFDFMLEPQTGNAYLIEMNPRATQVGHLQLGRDHDLPAALYAVLSGHAMQTAPRVTENDTIALFPQEWLRDPESEYLTTAYHDVPWAEAELVKDCVRKQQHKIHSNLHGKWVPIAPPLAASQPYAAGRLDTE